jgi:hypothetical protein
MELDMTLRNIFGAQVLNPIRIGRFLTHLPQFIRLFYGLLTDKRVPFLTKLVPMLGFLLLLSPPGLELDLIPIVGEVDALLIIYFSLKLFVWLCPPDVVREYVTRIGHTA